MAHGERWYPTTTANGSSAARLGADASNQSRAVAIDMESATVAGQGYRFAPLRHLCCACPNKPLTGEIKLPWPGQPVYEQAISEHMKIGMTAVELFAGGGLGLH